MQKTIIAFVAGLSLSAVALVSAAPGDLILQLGGARGEIAANKVSAFRAAGIAAGICPSGMRADDVQEIRAWKEDGQWYGVCSGLLTEKPSKLGDHGPGPHRVVGVVE